MAARRGLIDAVKRLGSSLRCVEVCSTQSLCAASSVELLRRDSAGLASRVGEISNRNMTTSTLSDSKEVSSVPNPFSLLDKRVPGPFTVEPVQVFAVIEISGTQYKVTPDDLIVTEKLSGVDINDTITLNRVLLLGSSSETVIGRPFIPEATVTAAVEEQFLDGKVIVFKKRRRKNSRRTNGHRQPLTSLRILSIEWPSHE